MTTDFAAKSAQYDRDTIAKARTIAAARNTHQLRTAITIAYPRHAAPLAVTPDDSVLAYAGGVMAEVIRELANLAEREINRNAGHDCLKETTGMTSDELYGA